MSVIKRMSNFVLLEFSQIAVMLLISITSKNIYFMIFFACYTLFLIYDFHIKKKKLYKKVQNTYIPKRTDIFLVLRRKIVFYILISMMSLYLFNNEKTMVIICCIALYIVFSEFFLNLLVFSFKSRIERYGFKEENINIEPEVFRKLIEKNIENIDQYKENSIERIELENIINRPIFSLDPFNRDNRYGFYIIQNLNSYTDAETKLSIFKDRFLPKILKILESRIVKKNTEHKERKSLIEHKKKDLKDELRILDRI